MHTLSVFTNLRLTAVGGKKYLLREIKPGETKSGGEKDSDIP
jgi:hypothetical protein